MKDKDEKVEIECEHKDDDVIVYGDDGRLCCTNCGKMFYDYRI